MSRQFDLHIHPIPSLRRSFPYIVNIQSDYLDALPTRLCASLFRGRPQLAIDRLEPVVSVDGECLILSVLDLATFRLSELGEQTGTIGDYRHEIVSAVDIVLTGV